MSGWVLKVKINLCLVTLNFFIHLLKHCFRLLRSSNFEGIQSIPAHSYFVTITLTLQRCFPLTHHYFIEQQQKFDMCCSHGILQYMSLLAHAQLNAITYMTSPSSILIDLNERKPNASKLQRTRLA